MSHDERREDAEVVVIGAGMAGLVLAHDLARAGVRAIVCEASDHLGGLLRRGSLAGLDVDLGAESFATRTDAVGALIADAGLDLDFVAPRPGGAFLAIATPEGVVRAPLPRRTVLGVPADPLAADVVAVIGADAAARAARERDWAPFAPGADDAAEPSLFDLVLDRCGPVVAERLVDTLCRSVYSRPAADLRLSRLHPGMWRALLDLGSLTAAADRLASDVRAGAAVGGIAGGMWRLPDALAAAARAHGAEIRTGIRVEAIEGDAGRLTVRTAGGEILARRVVVATGPAAADRLLGIGARDNATARVGAAGRVRVVVAAIDHSGLDAFAVGSGVIVDPALDSAAKALTHVTAKWAWADAAAPAGRHLVRLSARDARASEPGAQGLDDAADIARAVALLTGVDVQASDVVDLVGHDWTDAVDAGGPASADERASALAASARRGIHSAGAVAAGTGLASVIPHARALAARLVADLSDEPATARTPLSPPVNARVTDPTRSFA